jgi:hypothetical protein
MKYASMVILLGLSLLVPTEARANDGGWWDWLWKWDPKLTGVSSEIHVLCFDRTGARVRKCEEWFTRMPRLFTGKEIDHEFHVLEGPARTRRPILRVSDIKHEIDFRFGYFHNYGRRYSPPHPPSDGAIHALKLMGTYLYRVNDRVGFGGGAGVIPVWGERFEGTQTRGIVTGNMVFNPGGKWFAIRPEVSLITKGFTADQFGDPGVSYAKDHLWSYAVSFGFDLRRIGPSR